MVSVKEVIFLATSVAATVVTRDYDATVNDLKTINDDLVRCKNACSSYAGGFNGAAAVSNCLNTIDNDIKKASADAHATFTTTQATTIINYINNYLEPSCKSYIGCLDSKYDTFKSGGVQCQIESGLNTLKYDAIALGNTLVDSCPSAQKSAASSALNKLIADIQTGVNTFAPGC